MTKRTSHDDKRTTETRTDDVSRRWPSAVAIRETIESVVIAFILAFFFRTFEAEAFVIPTGSMAPTLMGRHKDLYCPVCGCPYQISASEEVDSDERPKGPQFQIQSGMCPMCRYTDANLKKDPSYSGDRILVSKLAYQWNDPRRWDVIVFKYPGDTSNELRNSIGATDSRTNFVKRLVGLPGETVKIRHGDIWIRRGEAEPFNIARKTPEKLLAMLQTVFDNDYMPLIAKDGWPDRWREESAGNANAAEAWTTADRSSFRTDGSAAGERWLRYHHLAPSFDQWAETNHTGVPPKLAPQLITDFTAYDTSQFLDRNAMLDPQPRPDSLGRFWVGDLSLSCTADIERDEGLLTFELRKGGRRFQCQLDVATGRAELSISGEDMAQFRPATSTKVRGPGRHEIMFSNCDNELKLWIDGRVAWFDSSTTYKDLDNYRPDQNDFSPVGVASDKAAVRLSRLRVLRDLYYISDLPQGDSHRFSQNRSGYPAGALGAEAQAGNTAEQPMEFPLKADQFFVLGDNSARSKDGRLWGSDNYYVPRDLLIGEALYVYWPHSWHRIPYVNIPFPYFPNFAKMRFVR